MSCKVNHYTCIKNINIREVERRFLKLKKGLRKLPHASFIPRQVLVKHKARFHRAPTCCLLCGVPPLTFLWLRDIHVALIGMKPEIHWTSLASVVSLFIGVENKTWPISHFCDWVDRQWTWLLTPPLKDFWIKPHITRRGSTQTTDRIESLLLINLKPIVSITFWHIDTHKLTNCLLHIIG